MNRPAEITTAAAAAAYLICYFAGALDEPGLMAALTVLIGVIPALVTFIVDTVRGR